MVGVMTDGRMFTALGLMSGTSMDGIDAALLRTDGRERVEAGVFLTVPYEAGFRERLRACLGGAPARPGAVAAVERELTDLHAAAVADLLREAGLAVAGVDLLGFHGHTILHAPAERRTWQIGDAARLAAATGIDTVADFRSADVAEGGQGAPLVPLYHAALAAGLERPLAVLNLGGVGNLTWLGAGGEVTAFDTGPGNALIDDFVLRRAGEPCDLDGRLAAAGRVRPEVLAVLAGHSWFDLPPPKSLDRDAWDVRPVEALGVEDGAATLTAFTAEAVARAAAHLPEPPKRWLVTGGGRRNPAMMAMLAERLAVPVEPVEAVGWQGDALEAQAFAYLAVRSVLGLPLSLPATTGVPRPMTGGRLFRAGG
jgi:anhydro-N-acetylmuramic acid kinase